MIVESIPQDLPNSQSPELNLGTIQKLPLTGFIKIDLKEAWVEFIKRFEPYEWYVTLTFKEPKHPEAADKAFLRWTRYINEFLYGRRYREQKKGCYLYKMYGISEKRNNSFSLFNRRPPFVQVKEIVFHEGVGIRLSPQ